MQISSSASVIFLIAPNVYSSISCNGIPGPKYDSCQHIWIFCYVGGDGSWRIHRLQRYNKHYPSKIFHSIISYSFSYFTMTVNIPNWWIWGFWFSPLMYAQNAASVNEFLGHSWDKVISLFASAEICFMLLFMMNMYKTTIWILLHHGLSSKPLIYNNVMKNFYEIFIYAQRYTNKIIYFWS